LCNTFEANYTRYADDLIVSGGIRLKQQRETIVRLITSIVLDEGFRVNHAKTRITTESQQQRMLGLVVNQRINTPRKDYDDLRAILHNCRTQGVVSQRERFHQHLGLTTPRWLHNGEYATTEPDLGAQLLGRIGWIAQANPDRGARLRAMFDHIDFSK
jgi:RNA-directed DNA polymerase